MGWQNAFQAIRQFSLPRTRALQEELGAVRAEHAAVSAELEAVRDEFARAQASDSREIHALQLQLTRIESDRDTARQQAQLLEDSLQQAQQRQAGTEQRLAALETQLQEARHQHESNLYLTRDALTRLQSEQQSLMSLQSDMARSFQEASGDLLKALQAQVKPRLSVLQMSFLASLLFLSGALATALVLQDSGRHRLDLSHLGSGIDDLQELMQAHFKTHDELMQTLTRLIDLAAQGRLVPDQGATAPQTAPPGEDSAAARQRRDNLTLLGLYAGQGASAVGEGGATDSAMQRFRQLYRPAGEPDNQADAALQQYADAVRTDTERFDVDSTVLAAIRLASLRTGVEFSYLMELAEVESSFDPLARAPTSTASGLYQFKDESWLDAISAYGNDYGLGQYAALVEHRRDDSGVMQPYIGNPAQQQRVLDLRFDPRLAALLAAEHVRNSRERLASSLERQPDRAELYLTHFFGTSGAISFLKVLAESPDRIAGELFPGPARRNRSIFQTRNRAPRTVAEVYRLLARKFNTARYEEG